MSFKRKFLTWFGDLKFSYLPMWLMPTSNEYDVSGDATRRVMDLVQPGDLVLRGYKNYVDGLFIPGRYSHTGVYMGNNKVLHAIAEGVVECDIIEFLRCDRFCVIRLKNSVPSAATLKQLAVEKMLFIKNQNYGYDFDFKEGNGAYYCHELGAEAYRALQIKQLYAKKFGFTWKFLGKKYLAESFLEDNRFEVILEG